MLGLSDIPGVDDDAIELLEAAGYVDLRALARCRAEDVADELERANEVLRITERLPGPADIERWVEDARRLSGAEPPVEVEEDGGQPAQMLHKQAEEDDRMVNFEADPVVAEMLENAPFAIPVPAALMAEREVFVGDVASGVMLTRVKGDLEIRVDARPSQRTADVGEEEREIGLAGLVKRGVDVSRIKSIDEVREERKKVRVSSTRSPDTKVDEFRTASVEVNRGKDPNSRRYIRGLLHPQPFKMRLAALVTLACQLMVLPAIGVSVVLLLAAIDPDSYGWVSPWLVVVPASLPVLGILYLLSAVGMKCRVCTQRVFMPRHCLRHPKAHHIPVVGYIFPLSLHLLAFSWCRCEYCGTATRLRK